jgi:hypothetical protein
MKWIVLKRSIFTIVMALIVIGCDQNNLTPLESNSIAPGQVTSVSVKNLPASAKITYTLPSEQDLLYVKAEYTLANGTKMQVKSSYYNNSLVVEGFADTKDHVITLYSVNRSEVASAPVLVTVTPLESPIWAVMRSIKNVDPLAFGGVIPAFAGVHIAALNITRANVSILLMEKNDKGDWTANPNSIYTSTDSIAKTIRGLSIVKHQFAITVRDRWLNTTDTLFTSITPYPESELDRSKFGNSDFIGDTPHFAANSRSGMWDNNLQDWPKVYLTDPAVLVPAQHTVTIDTGVLTKMSRIKIWDYPEYLAVRSYYNIGDLKDFEIWGWPSNTAPTVAGLDGWVKLGTYHATKPSGLPFGQQSSEDYNTALAGFSWDFDVIAPPVRYLKIKSIKNWAGLGTLAIAEIRVYGAPSN